VQLEYACVASIPANAGGGPHGVTIGMVRNTGEVEIFSLPSLTAVLRLQMPGSGPELGMLAVTCSADAWLIAALASGELVLAAAVEAGSTIQRAACAAVYDADVEHAIQAASVACTMQAAASEEGFLSESPGPRGAGSAGLESPGGRSPGNPFRLGHVRGSLGNMFEKTKQKAQQVMSKLEQSSKAEAGSRGAGSPPAARREPIRTVPRSALDLAVVLDPPALPSSTSGAADQDPPSIASATALAAEPEDEHKARMELLGRPARTPAAAPVEDRVACTSTSGSSSSGASEKSSARMASRQAGAVPRTADEIRTAYGRERKGGGGDEGSLGGLKSAMADNRDKLAERGEKLSRLQERTQKMEDEAMNFQEMAQKLAAQQAGKKWWQL
ncbi:hypothetical protein CYMTET_13083, partial [Cymbomonas tetramitiformis]